MSPEGQQLMAEMQCLFKEQATFLDRRFADFDKSVQRHIIDFENRIDGRINDAKHRQDERLKAIEQAMGSLESWHQDAEGVLNDMRLKVLKINRQLD
jgi:hypothetical protein